MTTEPDVVVVGGRAAGAVAALECHARGGSAVILEARDRAGGNSASSGGSIRLVTDAERLVDYLCDLSQGATGRDILRNFVAALRDVPEWLAQRGGDFRGAGRDDPADSRRMVFPASHAGALFADQPHDPALTGRAYLRSRHPGDHGGAALWSILSEELSKCRVPMLLDAPVRHLVLGDSGAVVGVEFERGGRLERLVARRGVVLACGGFARDPDRLIQSVGVALPTVSEPDCGQGDGIRLALEVGADLWHMSALATAVGYQFPGMPAAFYCAIRDHGFLLVDQLGHRYAAETDLDNHSAVHSMIVQDAITGRFLRAPSFVVFDEVTRLAGPVIRQPNGALRAYEWSEDNGAETAKGWIAIGDSPGELANGLGIPAAAMEKTIEEFNRCASGQCVDGFGRPSAEMRALIGPYYGIPTYPVVLNTQGGPRRDERSRVLRPDGSPITGLYGVGELGSIWGRLYPGTGNVSEALASGLIAARDLFPTPE